MPPRRWQADRGFALVGALVLLAVLATLVITLAPVEVLSLTGSNERETQRQLAHLVEAATGSAKKKTYGFVGDVGRLPKSLEELNATGGTHTLCDGSWDPSVVTYHTVDGSTDHRGHAPMGWNGPYIRRFFSAGDYLVDSWGQTLRYTCPESTKPDTDPITGGVALTTRTGQITSAGPDGVFDTADDLTSDEFFDRGNVLMTVRVGQSQATPQNLVVTLFYPANGEQTSVTSTPVTIETETGSEKLIPFGSVPAGIRFVQIDVGANTLFFNIVWDANIGNAMLYLVPQAGGGGGRGG
ncbi:MAG: hypothetical protein QF681_06455 [Vicinamibacterales bacterium]|nr:hypothetical protein [Vicinamibacterales bacterium]